MTAQSFRRWAAAHPEENRARAKAWYNANADRAYERNRTWKLQNPERTRELNKAAYYRAHPRPPCVMCERVIEPRQRFMCRRCAREADRARQSEYKAARRKAA